MEKNKNYFYRLAEENDGFICIPFDPNDKNNYKYTYYIKWQDHVHDTKDKGEIVYDTYVSDIMTDLRWASFRKGGYLVNCNAFITVMKCSKGCKNDTYQFFQIDGKDPNNQDFSMTLFFPSSSDVFCFAKYFMKALSMLEEYKDHNKVSDVFETLYGPVNEQEGC